MLPEDLQEILEWDTTKLWKTINTIDNVKKEYPTEYKKIKEGVTLKIPIQWITEEWYEEYPHSKKVRVKGYGKYSLQKFMEEKEERDKLMRKIIESEMKTEEPTKPRQ